MDSVGGMMHTLQLFECSFCGEAMGYFEDIQKIVRMISRGKVATYGNVARAAGYPGAARQVAWALRASSAKRLPWQRVLGSGGKILLRGEAGLHQRTLLEVEGVRFRGNRVDMERYEFAFRCANPDSHEFASSPQTEHHRGKRRRALQPRESVRFSNTREP
jgi:methylated-DNA-protein-cysteine methyltransferase related protein